MVTNLCDLHKPFALLTFISVAEFIASISFFLKLIDEHLAVVGGRSLDGNGKDGDDGDALHGYSDVEQVSTGASVIVLASYAGNYLLLSWRYLWIKRCVDARGRRGETRAAAQQKSARFQ